MALVSCRWQQDVRDFMSGCGQVVRTLPTMPPESEMEPRARLIREEYREVMHAFEERDPVAISHEMADLIYVLLGTACTMGVRLEDVWLEIHSRNMTKLAGGLDENGKVRKPPGFVGPNVRRGLIEQGMRYTC